MSAERSAECEALLGRLRRVGGELCATAVSSRLHTSEEDVRRSVTRAVDRALRKLNALQLKLTLTASPSPCPPASPSATPLTTLATLDLADGERHLASARDTLHPTREPDSGEENRAESPPPTDETCTAKKNKDTKKKSKRPKSTNQPSTSDHKCEQSTSDRDLHSDPEQSNASVAPTSHTKQHEQRKSNIKCEQSDDPLSAKTSVAASDSDDVKNSHRKNKLRLSVDQARRSLLSDSEQSDGEKSTPAASAKKKRHKRRKSVGDQRPNKKSNSDEECSNREVALPDVDQSNEGSTVLPSSALQLDVDNVDRSSSVENCKLSNGLVEKNTSSSDSKPASPNVSEDVNSNGIVASEEVSRNSASPSSDAKCSNVELNKPQVQNGDLPSVSSSENSPIEKQADAVENSTVSTIKLNAVSAENSAASVEFDTPSGSNDSALASNSSEECKPKLPLIKCVNIATLLKPTVVEKLKLKSSDTEKSRSGKLKSPLKSILKKTSLRSSRVNKTVFVISSDSSSEEEQQQLDDEKINKIKADILADRCKCRVNLTAYPKDEDKLQELLISNNATSLFDHNLQLVASTVPEEVSSLVERDRMDVEKVKEALIKCSDQSDCENANAESSPKRKKLKKKHQRRLSNSSEEEINKLVTIRKSRKCIASSDEDLRDSESEKNSNAKSKSSKKKETSNNASKSATNKINSDDAESTNGDLTLKSEEDAKNESDLNSPNDAIPDAAAKEMITDFLKSATEKTMSRLTSDLLNGDTSTSDEESPKVNGTAKKSKVVKSSDKEDNGTDSSSSRSKKKKHSKPTKHDSDSDNVKMCDDDEKTKAENSDNSVAALETVGGTDSDDSDVRKPTKKKRKKTAGESSDDSPVEQKNQKKRRRIKNVSGDDSDNSEDNSDGSDGSDDDGTNKKGRKNIRKVKSSDNLDEATKIAARNERNRLQRIADRQKLYNDSLFDESGRPDEVIKLDKVILDFDPVTKEPLISVDIGLVEKLKPHQANGVKFMWDACFESVKQIKNSKGSGCILAHCMGLGKTLQIVALTHTLLTHQKFTKVERVLVVCPLSTVHNWVNEYQMWLKHAKCKTDIEIYEISKLKQNYERSSKLRDWLENGGVCVLGYDMFRNLSADNNKKFRKAQLTYFQKALVDPGPDLVVCDEGHLLKNEKTSLSQSMNRVKSLRRIVLTGTPLQNNLKEYYCMVQFVKPNLLGKYNEYLNRFVNPITNGQYTDSTEHDIRIMKRRSHVLHKMLDGGVQRRDYAVLAPFLPPKHEYILFISLTEIQIKLYSFYMENFSRRPQPDRKNTGFLFPDFQALQRIWTHPLVLKANSERYEIMQQKKRDREEEDSEGSLADFIDDDSTTPEESSESEETTEDSDDSAPKNKKKKSKPKKTTQKRVTRATAVSDDEVIEVKQEETRQDNPTEWWMSLCSEDELDQVRHSNKLILLLDILKQCEAIGDKLLVFSQSLYSLDLIEQFLWKIDEATQKGEDDEKLAGHVGSWSAGLDYFRLDGSTSCENRAIWCKNFNKEDNPRARLFLISTRAGGLGINLVAANRVIIFDMSWNPSHDVQSIFRVYRFGQKKPCYIYRFLALGTMEEKIYERQVTKQAISKRVIDEQQIDRHYAESDLAELYTFCPVPEGTREVPKLPKDRLFADLLKQHDTVIYKYHEHDSLLENKEEETLTEEERKAAWEDYENEKTRPPPNFGNQMMAGFQQQQQHHLAMSAVLQQEFPGLSEQQVATMIPSILQTMYQNGDQALSQQLYPGYDLNMMQKMNAMVAAQNTMAGFKYPQNSMMNSNLQPLMKAGTGVSGANYQLPWQQQQQMQLQRLQQQQAMQANLKYYAGGLGSRDTIDMAALQQQQRAMIMASSTALPQRGRPPKNSNLMQYPLFNPSASTATKPPVTTGDIVDLDSE